ncbi:transposase [Scytonema tolypothrichoides VB-61278]|nr:transposase [Scytonema tolypothrichoides VB-61278]
MQSSRTFSREVICHDRSTTLGTLPNRSADSCTHCVDRWFPSTQLCSCCGQKKTMNLSDRIYSCDGCGFTLNRDFNAALNLENYIR